MADFALIAPDDCYHSSVGACLDGFALVRDHIAQLFAEGYKTRMETGLRVLTLDGLPVRTGDGRTIVADGGIDGPTDSETQFDMVHIASFRVHGLRQLDGRLATAGPFLAWLRRQHDGGALIASSGAATFFVAAAGLVDALPVPLPRALVSIARQRLPRMLIDERRQIVEHGRIVMGSGLAADQALMVRVIERTLSVETGHWLASVIGLDQTVEDLSQDPLIAHAQLWLEQRFANDARIADLAAAMSTSHQTLIRRFVRELGVRPKDYVQRLRIRSAAQMLRRTNRTVDQIAATVGYRDTRSFRTVFRAQMGMTATAYRGLARGDPRLRG